MTAGSTHGESAELMARVSAALATVTDPELPFLTIAEMGILRSVALDGGIPEVTITPTYSGCPAMDVIAIDIETTLAKAGFKTVRIRQALAPAWTTDWLSETARLKLRENGIAPPERAARKRALFSTVDVACPVCGSGDTERVSEFGSTACKAQYQCLRCNEPFQYFKCI